MNEWLRAANQHEGAVDDLGELLDRALDFMRRHGNHGDEHLQLAQDIDDTLDRLRGQYEPGGRSVDVPAGEGS